MLLISRMLLYVELAANGNHYLAGSQSFVYI